MKISKKSEYGAKALIEMARSAREGLNWQQISQIAAKTRIPEKFLEQILLSLKNERILKSRRGIGGGYSLNLSENQITLDRIILILDGPQSLASEDVSDTEVGKVLATAISKAERASQDQLKNHSLAFLADEVQLKLNQRKQISEYDI